MANLNSSKAAVDQSHESYADDAKARRVFIVDSSGTEVSLGVESSFSHGAKSSITTSAVQMVVSSTPATQGVLVKAALANTANVHVGGSASVTVNASDSTDGFELGAGESIVVPVNDANLIYLIAASGSQKVYWVVV